MRAGEVKSLNAVNDCPLHEGIHLGLVCVWGSAGHWPAPHPSLRLDVVKSVAAEFHVLLRAQSYTSCLLDWRDCSQCHLYTSYMLRLDNMALSDTQLILEGEADIRYKTFQIFPRIKHWFFRIERTLTPPNFCVQDDETSWCDYFHRYFTENIPFVD